MEQLKKLFCIVTILFLAIPTYAQEKTEHLKFMGIPLTGNITSFQTKLQAKGVKYDQKTSKEIKAGCRAFVGTFSGEKATIFVYYNEKTKIVYRAKAVITCLNKEAGERMYRDFESMLKSKYSTHVATESEHEGRPSISILVTDSNIKYTLGYVGLYITNPPYHFMDELYLHIDYEDVTNERNNTKRNMDDL